MLPVAPVRQCPARSLETGPAARMAGSTLTAREQLLRWASAPGGQCVSWRPAEQSFWPWWFWPLVT